MSQSKHTFVSWILMLMLFGVVVTIITFPRRQRLRVLQQDPKTVIMEPDFRKHVIYVLDISGTCSQLVNMLCQKIGIESQGGRFMADEVTYWSRWDEKVGLLSGFFQPDFPVIDHRDQFPQIEAQFGIPKYKWFRRKDKSIFNISQTDTNDKLIMRTLSGGTRRTCWDPETQRPANKSDYMRRWNSDKQRIAKTYALMAKETCTHLQFNARTKSLIQQLKAEHNMPNFRKGSTVAFHIRRGDKIKIGESKFYPASAYVDKLLNVTQEPIDHCFVASDDYASVEEVKVALRRHNINCKVHTMTSKNDTGFTLRNQRKKGMFPTIEFLAQMSILTNAKYFIGTFNSNVAALTALRRECVHKGAVHYANSYGVDGDEWYIR